MTFQPGDIVVCVDGWPIGSLYLGLMYEVERVGGFVYLHGVQGGWIGHRFRLATDEEKKQFLKGKR
jgi:hypothetical protein